MHKRFIRRKEIGIYFLYLPTMWFYLCYFLFIFTFIGILGVGITSEIKNLAELLMSVVRITITLFP